METGDILQPGMSIRPKIDNEEVQTIVKTFYGLKVLQIVELNGYDDKNFHVLVRSEDNENVNIDVVCKSGYVLKIVNLLDSKNELLCEGQNALLLHLRRNYINCPEPILTKDGQYFTKITLSSGTHIIRLLEYISGTILCKAPFTPNLFYQSGLYIAKINKALKDFHHPVYNSHKTLWMLESVPKLPKFLYAIKDECNRKLLNKIITEFSTRVLAASDKLEKGMIHGDYNEQNIIVAKENSDWKIKAVIDFGDSHFACYLYELAIAMTYMILQSKDIDTGGYVLAGYTSVRSLPDSEFYLLKICIVARLCQSLVLGAYSNLQDPQNTYVLTTALQGWILLKKLWEEPEENLLQRWKTISEEYRSNT